MKSLRLFLRAMQVLSPGERSRVWLTLLPMLSAAVAQSLGIIATASVVAVLSRESLSGLPAAVQQSAGNGGVVLGGAILIVLGNLISWISLSVTVRVSWATYEVVSARTLAAILCGDFLEVSAKNPVLLAKETTTDALAVVTQIIGTGLDVLQRVLMASFTVAVLVSLAPAGVLALLLVGGAYYGGFSRWARRRSRAVAEGRHHAAGAVLEGAAEAVAGLREIRLLSAEASVVDVQRRAVREYVKFAVDAQLVSRGPRFGLESFALAALLIVNSLAPNADGGLSVIGAFAVGLFRLLPALQIVYAGLQAIGLAEPALTQLERRLRTARHEPASNTAEGAAVPLETFELRGVSIEQPDTGRKLIDGINIVFRAGETVLIKGPSGCGKTSLLDVIATLREPAEGELLLNGRALLDLEKAVWRTHIGYASQQSFVVAGSLEKNIQFAVEARQDPSLVERARRISGLSEAFPDGKILASGGSNISGGQRQRVAIARALSRAPQVLVLDEATSGLDDAAEELLFKRLKEEQPTLLVIVVSHRASTAQWVDRVIQL